MSEITTKKQYDFEESTIRFYPVIPARGVKNAPGIQYRHTVIPNYSRTQHSPIFIPAHLGRTNSI
jgi:hypothetical protein